MSVSDLEEKFLNISQTDPYHYTNEIVPELEGYEDLKRKLFLLLLTPLDETPTQRDRLHLLMYGSPGTGKTVILRWLHRTFDAIYLTQDTTIASLKADARRKDLGVQILAKAHGNIVCFDEFSLLKGREELRDAMEDGYYKIAKSGKEVVMPAQIRVVAATNEVKLSEAMIDRFDFVVHFEDPSPDLSTNIAKRLTRIYAGIIPTNTEELKQYIDFLNEFDPKIPKDILHGFDRIWEAYFTLKGIGYHGRWIASVLRIAKAIAKAHRRDIMPEDVVDAIKMKDESLPSSILSKLKKLAEKI